jgi:hypothetical protein
MDSSHLLDCMLSWQAITTGCAAEMLGDAMRVCLSMLALLLALVSSVGSSCAMTSCQAPLQLPTLGKEP